MLNNSFYSRLYLFYMNQKIVNIRQHSPTKNQVANKPAKEMSKFLQKKQYTAEDLIGLSWMLFEESQ